jgi:hypothetical protein
MRIPPAPTPEPGEWQTDKDGKRYRMVGKCIEYEPEINGIPESVFFARQKRQAEQRAAELEREKKEAAERAAQRRNCPFRDGMQTVCTREACALFLNGCTLARLADQPPAKDTEGLQCPFSKYRSKCRKDCALYRNGCTLTGIKESEDK